jgi:hypothetical protein
MVSLVFDADSRCRTASLPHVHDHRDHREPLGSLDNLQKAYHIPVYIYDGFIRAAIRIAVRVLWPNLIGILIKVIGMLVSDGRRHC